VVNKRKRKAQFVVEWSWTLAITFMVMILMFNYLNRGVQGKLKEQFDTFNDEQFAGTTAAQGSAFATESRSMTKTTTTFSYEGGKYEPSISTSSSNRRDTSNFVSPR